jgi:transglutaminase-like putative cysteine protease
MNAPRYSVEHETHYSYTAPVTQSWQLARLTPRTLPWQRLLSHALQIDPQADERHDAPDGFGNTVTHFSLHGAHRVLRVRMRAMVEVGARSNFCPAPEVSMPWERVRDLIRSSLDDLQPVQMSQATVLLPMSAAAAAYALPSLQVGRDWLEAVIHLMQRIHHDFEFNPASTNVSTSVDEVLQQRSGVCQDFAHLMLACLRAHGLAARYVSGYLLTDAPPGQPRLMGVDASHAWISAYSPSHGWVELDPTNNQLADERYITLAYGTDFADVVPLRGVILGGGQQSMRVSVSVSPLDGPVLSVAGPDATTAAAP